MKTTAIIVAVVLLIVAAGGSYVHSLRSRLAGQNLTIAEQDRLIGQLSAAGDGKDAAIKDLQESKKRDETIVAETAAKIEKLSTHIDDLTRKTQGALRHAPHLTLDSLLPAAAADALCLQWRAASGRRDAAATNHPRDAAAGADARAVDPLAAVCRGWRRLTVGGAVEWNGLLLRHAGLEREDKAALRRWAVEVGK